MTDRTKTLAAVLLTVAAFAFLFASVRSTPFSTDEGAPGLVPASQTKPATDFALTNVATGKKVDLLEQAQATPVVFSFWATWCGPCRQELPHLEQLSRQYKGRVAFYGVNGDDTPAAIKEFARQNHLTFPMLSDSQRDAARKYGIDAIPRMIVVDTRGHVRADSDGFDPGIDQHLPAVLDALLAQKMASRSEP